MNLVRIKVIETKGKTQLRDRIKVLFKNKNVKVDSSRSLESFSNNLSVDKYNVLLIANDEISNNGALIFKQLEAISTKAPRIQILFFVQEENIDLGVRALKVGTYQYVKLPVGDTELKLIIQTAIDQQPKIIKDNYVDLIGRQKFGEIIGGSEAMLHVYDQILQSANTDIPVLILGATGTGKDLVAHTIHKISDRSENPYLAVNLGALPSELVSSELFGHERGAFTGALKQHKGVFEQGSNGTVFLDEIDSMDEKIQVSLLRLLEQKKFKRLGGSKSLNSKARLIAATNENLDKLVEAGVFRMDLFYRLDVFRILLPPLKERIDDIPLLVDEMLLKYSKIYKKNITSISKTSMQALMNFDWPGNIRELKNVIQRAVLVCNGKTLQIKHFPKRFIKNTEKTNLNNFPFGSTLAEMELHMIKQALLTTNNNKKEAAKLLGISRRAIYNKLQKYNL